MERRVVMVVVVFENSKYSWIGKKGNPVAWVFSVIVIVMCY